MLSPLDVTFSPYWGKNVENLWKKHLLLRIGSIENTSFELTGCYFSKKKDISIQLEYLMYNYIIQKPA